MKLFYTETEFEDCVVEWVGNTITDLELRHCITGWPRDFRIFLRETMLSYYMEAYYKVKWLPKPFVWAITTVYAELKFGHKWMHVFESNNITN